MFTQMLKRAAQKQETIQKELINRNTCEPWTNICENQEETYYAHPQNLINLQVFVDAVLRSFSP
jgi:hypothetical protein